MAYFRRPGRDELTDRKPLDEFATGMIRGFQSLGIEMPRNLPPLVRGTVGQDVRVVINDMIAGATKTFGSKPQVLVFFRHGADAGFYRTCKQICDVDLGIVSQGEPPPISRMKRSDRTC